MKKRMLFLTTLFLINFWNTVAQDLQLLMEKKGDFKLINWGIYTNCIQCGYTPTEEKSNWNELTQLAEIFHQTPILREPTGFKSKVLLYHQYFGDPKDRYGIPGQMKFQFCYFFKNSKNQEVSQDIEPPAFNVILNQIYSTYGSNMGFRESDNNKVKEKFYFFTPDKKETLAPGIDRYADEHIIIYNPNRPDYWIPVTIQEIFDYWIAYYQQEKDQYTRELTLKILQDQLALFTEDERKQNAYFGARGEIPLLTVDTQVNDRPLMQENLAYWDKSLSRSKVQILQLNLLKDQKRYEKEAEQELKNGDGGLHLKRFLASLDLEFLIKLQQFIEK
jgi:hypothetical protein